MNPFRIALANLPFPESPEDSVERARSAIALAAAQGAALVCFPECFIPGLRGVGKPVAPPDAAFLEQAWKSVRAAAAAARIAVVLGTERLQTGRLFASAMVINPDGSVAGFQDKVQLDPTEDGIYSPASERRVFQLGPVTFGISICHEGWRYPETVRWPVRHGAQLVFHPHFSQADAGSFRPSTFADPRNTFHEKAMLCRAAENTCYFASVNYAGAGSPTTSAVVGPEGNLLAFQPYGTEGLLLAGLNLSLATGLLATRLRD